MDRPAADSRDRWLWSHPILIAIVASVTVGAVAPLLGIPVPAVSMLVDVMSSIMWSSIVDKALLDWNYFLASRWWLLMN